MVSQRPGRCLKSFLEPVRFVWIEYELIPSHGDPIQPPNYQFHAFPDLKVKSFESRMSSSCKGKRHSGLKTLYFVIWERMKFTILGLNWVAVARYELILNPNEAHGLQEALRHLPDLLYTL